jgi:hypothetical protein
MFAQGTAISIPLCIARLHDSALASRQVWGIEKISMNIKGDAASSNFVVQVCARSPMPE